MLRKLVYSLRRNFRYWCRGNSHFCLRLLARARRLARWLARRVAGRGGDGASILMLTHPALTTEAAIAQYAWVLHTAGVGAAFGSAGKGSVAPSKSLLITVWA